MVHGSRLMPYSEKTAPAPGPGPPLGAGMGGGGGRAADSGPRPRTSLGHEKLAISHEPLIIP